MLLPFTHPEWVVYNKLPLQYHHCWTLLLSCPVSYQPDCPSYHLRAPHIWAAPSREDNILYLLFPLVFPKELVSAHHSISVTGCRLFHQSSLIVVMLQFWDYMWIKFYSWSPKRYVFVYIFTWGGCYYLLFLSSCMLFFYLIHHNTT